MGRYGIQVTEASLDPESTNQKFIHPFSSQMGHGFLCMLHSPYLVLQPKENEDYPNHNRNRSILPDQGLVFETLHVKEMELSKQTSSSVTPLIMNNTGEKLNRHPMLLAIGCNQ